MTGGFFILDVSIARGPNPFPRDDLVYNQDVTWTHWPEEGTGSPTAHEKLERDHLVSILRSGAIFARKLPPGADIAQYRLHLG